MNSAGKMPKQSIADCRRSFGQTDHMQKAAVVVDVGLRLFTLIDPSVAQNHCMY